MSGPILTPRAAALKLLLPTHAEQRPLFVAVGEVPPGDQLVPYVATTNAGEHVQIVSYRIEGTLPILETEHGADYITWAAATTTLTRLTPEHLQTDFLTERLVELRTQIDGLHFARARVSSHARDEILLALAPLEIDAYLLAAELKRQRTLKP